MSEAPTTHEHRARQAKAAALATVLADTDLIDDPAAVRALSPAGWQLAATLATYRNLLGEGRTVHPPNSDATVRAVEMALRGMAAAANVTPMRPRTDAGRVETVAGTPVHLDDNPEPWLDDDDSAEYRSRKPTDSQGYRRTMADIAPLAGDPFAGFPQ